MSTPNSPLLPVDRLQVAAAFSSQGTVQFDFRDRLDSIDSDLTDTERESERLARKLNKRLSGSHPDLTSPAEYFIERLTKWHSNKKVERLKALLPTHVPRVKHLEEDVVNSAVTVHENKEAVTRQAVALLGLVDKQIDYYQNHMNFLDDVINDIRQCDYTLVREITEMKAAFAFYQEVDTRPRNSSRCSTGPAARPCSVLLKLGLDSAGVGYVPGRRIFEDDAVALGFGDVGTDIVTAADGSDVTLPCTEAASKGVVRLTPTALPIPAVEETGAFDPVLDTRDGAEYKRKCLKSHAVNLQSLNLDLRAVGKPGAGAGAHGRNGAHSGDHAHHPHQQHHAEPKRASSMSPSMLMRHVSERLSEMTHFNARHAHPATEKKASEGKHRSWSVSSVTSNSTSSGTTTSAAESRSGRSATLGSGLPPLNLDQLPNGGSVSSHGHLDPALAHAAQAASAPVSLVHSTTPRPSSLSAADRCLPHTKGNNMFTSPTNSGNSGANSCNSAQGTAASAGQAAPAIPVVPSHQHEASHKVEGGIAFEGAAPVVASPQGDFFSHERQIQHLTAASILAHSNGHSGHGHNSHGHGVGACLAGSHPSLAGSGQISTSSSCSNLSNGSNGAPVPATTGSQLDRTERRRLRYAALRNHYPNLYQIANSHGSDPATKLLARRLNKCLMFKDELKRSLVRAEQVQEAENSCLCKMRKVQHELQDAVEDATSCAAGQGNSNTSAHSSVGLSLSSCGSPLALSSPSPLRAGLYINTDPTVVASTNTASTQGAPSASSDASHSSADEVAAAAAAGAGANASAAANAGVTDGVSPNKVSPRCQDSVVTHLSQHLSEHDFSSTDDEHDHLTASHTSSQSRDNSFSQLHSDTTATTPRAATTSGASAVGSGSHNTGQDQLQRIPSDPTVIDPSQDAVVNQISYELCEAARRCAQQLRVLQDEEVEATDKLNRVRSLLSRASHIDHELVTKLTPTK